MARMDILFHTIKNVAKVHLRISSQNTEERATKDLAKKRQMKSIFLTTFGCQMNKADSELSLGLLLERGYQLAGDESSADVVLFNTCSVRQRAEDRVYSRLSQLKASKTRRPGLVIGVLGCVAQKEGEEIFRRYPHVDMVCGTRMFDKLPELLDRLGSNGGHLLAISDEKVVSYPRRRPPRENPYQAYITVMRGCDNYCSYCIVPHVRGPEISRTVEEIVREAESLAREGCKEITLLGQNINTYGKTLEKGTNLASLLRAVSKVEGL